jgi:hypothetical protein
MNLSSALIVSLLAAIKEVASLPVEERATCDTYGRLYLKTFSIP